MKISLSWIRELVDVKAGGEELAQALTRAGLEVEGRAPFGALSGVMVAEVRGKMPHPNASKLTLVDVWDGRAVTQVVCGAPNVPEPGARVVWARPGARLPSGIELQAKEVRGIVSPGMLCAEDELGFGASHAGIIVLGAEERLQPGDDLAAALGLPDEIWEVNVTPNRPDCLGHLGIARELAALTGAALKMPAIAERREDDAPAAAVTVEDAEGCARYTALVVDGVTVGPSPLATRLRLAALGQRSLSNVVDATNLALQLTGQPLHAFDLDKLTERAIVVRRARAGETLRTLDGQARALAPDDVVIADATRAVAVAGVMGGADTEVTGATRRILIESAYFDPARVRRTAKRLGLHTEASHRFERGVDPDGAPWASRWCAQLVDELAGGATTPHRMLDVYPRPMAPREVALRLARTRALLGADVPDAEQERILAALGLDPVKRGESLIARVPPRRPDLTREVDLIEEIARVRGYDSIGATLPRLESVPAAPGSRTSERARDALMGLGFDEVVTYALVAPERLRAFGVENFLRIANPIREELSAMRTTLIAGLTGALERNLLRGVADVKLFEVGEVFLPTGGAMPDERRRVAGVLAGRADGWLRPGAELDLFDVKGAVEELLSALGHAADYEAGAEPWLHPGAQARVTVGDRPIGALGELHPDLARALGLEVRALVFELDLASLGPAPAQALTELPRFPAVTRDLSFFIAAHVTSRELARAIAAARDPLCAEFRVVEDYREPGKVPAGKKGMLWSFTYRAPDRTLTDAEVQALHDALRARLQQSLQIEPR